jgi:hypothetical protein
MFGYNHHRLNDGLRTTAAVLILPVLIPLLVQAQQSPGGTETDRRFAEMTALIQKLQARGLGLSKMRGGAREPRIGDN